MKRIIRKFWGIALVVVMISTLLITVTPAAAADPLNWEYKIDQPSGLFAGLNPGSDVVDYAVSGPTMYAVTGRVPLAVPVPGTPGALYQSASGGAMWTDISVRISALADIGTTDFVAMAPDDPNFVIVADATPAAGLCAAISTNGGATWSSMGIVQSSTAVAVTGVKGIAISPLVTGGFRYIAIYGTAGAGAPGLYYYSYGPGIGAWRNAALGAAPDFVTAPVNGTGVVAYDSVVAFQFSPNFPSDYMAAAVLEDTAVLGAVDYHILSFNSFKWDTPVAAGYPVTVFNGTAGVTVNKASLVLSPDYDGSDESLRIGFFGASITDTATTFEVGGVWRFFDSAPAGRIFGAVASKGPGIASVAYDGTNLAAGAYLTNFVYRSADAMAATPTFLPGRNYKQIGVNDPAVPDIVLLKFDGATLYGAKSGDASAISKSLDYGNTWSDYTMLDNAITVADDILMSATGDPWYLAAHDAITTAIYRISMFAVTRVLCVYPADAAAFILRGISTNPGVLYAADQTALNTIFYTADGGVSRWYKRIAPATIADLAVESQSVIYIGNGANVYKSTNSGFTWGLPVSTKLPGGAIYSMLSVGDSKLIIGGTAGGVNWSTDGGATWFVSFGIGGTNVIVAASGLAAGDYVFAANTAASPGVTGTDVYRAAIGPANPFGEFKSMQAPNVAVVAEIITGIVYTNGVLYIVSTDPLTGVFGTSYLTRTLMPTFPGTHIGVFWSQYAEAGEVFNRGISDLRASSGAPGDIMLYGIDTNFQLIYYFQDTLALNAPVLTGPTDKSLIQLTSALLGSSQNVNFTWNRISLATSYFLLVALDSFFTQPVALTAPVQPIVSSAPVVSAIVPGVNFQPGLTYYWAVVSFAPLSSAMSEVRSFTVQQVAASVPNISSPLNGAIGVGTNPSFSWSPISGTTKYEFQLSDTTNFDIAMFSEQLSNTGIQPTGLTLKAGKTYFWRVRAYEPTQGDWSSIANFTVAVPATTTPPPVTVTTNPPAQITVTTPPPVTVILPTTETKTISPAYIWAIIIIGAVLVIAVIVLIVRTRRSV